MSSRRSIVLVVLALAVCAVAADATVRCWNHELEVYREQVRPVPPELMVRSHTGNHPMTPPDNPDVGDSWLWYTWRLNGYPTPEELMCTVRGEGENVYVVVEDSQWLTNVDQEDIDAIVEAWDNSSLGIHSDLGIYEINTTYFGPAPDALDNDPKIYVLYYDFDVAADGFFWYFDQYPDGTQAFASNECEVLYMNSSDFDPGGEYLIAVEAHEFEHQIHWLADEDEVGWVDEGMAELAMWLYGSPDHVSSFPNQPDNELTDFAGAWADYIQVYLWSLYFFEQFDLSVDAIRTVMDEPANSYFGYDNALVTLGSDRDFNAMFSDWTCANFLDDPEFDQGQYGYIGEELPTFNSILKNSYPVPPTNGSVNRYAADYVKFVDGLPQRLLFDGTDYGSWAPRVLLIDGDQTVGVGTIPLDAADAGSFDLFDFGETHDTAVLVIGKFSPGGFTAYNYSTDAIPTSVDPLDRLTTLALHHASPNPMREGGTIRLDLARDQQVEVTILGPSGRRIRTLRAGPLEAGSHPLTWDGRDDEGRLAPAGVYFVRARAEDGEANARWIRVD